MIILRSLLFNIFFWIWTFCLTFFTLPALIMPKIIAIYLSKIWSKGCIIGLKHIIGVKFIFEGFDKLPETSFITASKHQSALETIILPSKLTSPVFILKKQLLSIPFFGFFLKKLGMISVRTTQKRSIKNLIPSVKKVIENNQQLVIFPEGSRTMPGQQVKYKKGILRIHEALPDVPIFPIALSTGQVWPRKSFLKYPGICHIKVLPPIKAKEDFLKELKTSIETESLKLLSA